MTSDLAVHLLGEVEARRSADVIPIPGLKMQALLALLALAAPGPVSDGRILDELWGDERLSNPTNSLHSQIAILRRTIGRDAVARVGHGYALDIGADGVDAARFEALVERSRQLANEGDHRSAAQGFRAAIDLVTAAPLGDLVDYPFAREAAARFEELLLAAHEGRADAELALGRHAELVVPLHELVRRHPLRERFHAQLITALYRCGRQADALRAFGAARETLVEELGLEPGPELRDLELAVLSHDPSLAAPALAELSQPAVALPIQPATAPGIPRTPEVSLLVGRDDELARLRSDLDDACSGRGRIALLAGEPGIGKTRLAEELAVDAAARGAGVAWGRCYGGRGAPAFWPWTQVVQSLIDQFPRDAVTVALGRGAADVGQLVPEVRDLVPELERPRPLGPEFERFRLCDALTRTIRTLAGERPLMVVLEDLHWADGASLEMFSFLAGAMFEASIMVVGTYRDVGARTSDSLVETLADLARQPVVRRVDLVGLDADGVRTMLTSAAMSPTEDLVRSVHRRTQGNPFFLGEVLRLRVSSGAGDDLAALPAGVRDVIRQRVGLLPEPTSTTMVAACVLGSAFELATLAASIGDDAATTLQRLEAAFDARLLVTDPDRPGRYRFVHALVRDTLYEELGVAARALLHRRAAEALETVHGATDGPHLLALAEHWFHAAPLADPERGIDHAMRAARWAQRHVAHRQAEDHLRHALVLVEALPDGQRRRHLELDVQHELSMLLVRTAGYASPAVELTCRRMRTLCESVDDPDVVVPALWRVATLSCVNDDLDDAIAIGEHLGRLATEGEHPTALLTGHMLLGMVHTRAGDQSLARQHIDEAITMCRDGHHRALAGFVAEGPAAWVHVCSAMNLAMLGHDEDAERYAQEAIALAAASGEGSNVYAVTCATWFAAVVATIRGDVVTARQRCEDGIAMATAEGGGRMFVPFLTAHLGWALARHGDVDVGLAQIQSSARTVGSTGASMWRHVFGALAADVCVAAQRYAEALAHADEALSALRPGGERWYEAEVHRLRGRALAGLDPSDTRIDEEFAAAVAIADRQGAVVFRRRAEAGLATL